MSQSLRIARIIWAAFLATQSMFLVVLFILRSGGGLPPAPESPVMAIGLAAFSLGEAAVSFVLPARLLRTSLRGAKLQIGEERDPDAVGLYRDTAPKKRMFTDPKRALQRLFVAHQAPFIVGIALCESVSINGLVLGLMGFDLPVVLPFFAVGTLLIAVRFPRRGALIALLEKTYDAELPPDADRG